MYNFISKSLNICSGVFFVIVIALIASAPVFAEDASPEQENLELPSKGTVTVGMSIGALTIIGVDLRFTMRETQSPWIFGVRYMDVKDDFINEAAYGLPDDKSDKLYTKKIGVFANYLFRPRANHSLYASGAMYSVTKRLVCDSESDSDSTANIYFGGGYQGRWTGGFGYQVGILFSPFNSSTLKTTNCESEENGDIDVNVSLVFGF